MEPLILLVEDELLIGLTLQDALEDAGYRICHVLGGDDALSQVAAEGADFAGLITDINLGRGMDGWQLARRAREAKPHLPIVFMSGDSAHEHSAHGVPNSIMLQKPFAVAQVVTAISTLLNALPPSAVGE